MRVSRNRGDVTTAPDRLRAKARNDVRGARARPKPVADRFRAGKPRTFDLPGLLESVSRVRRGAGPEGSEPLIGKAERERVTALFGALSPARSAALQKLLLAVPEGAAQALLLKGIAARAQRLPGDDRPLNVLTRFAALLKSTPQDELLERGTVLDLDSTVSTSDVDLMPMWSKRGTIRPSAAHGELTDNDGLLQVFTAS